MKKTIFLFIALSSVLYTWAYDFEVDGIFYNITSSVEPYTVEVTYETTSYNSYSGDVIIPESVNDNSITYTVSSIGKFAYRMSSNLTSIFIPSSISSIGDYAFNSCSQLNTVSISEGVTSIGEYAFCQSTSLSSIVIPSTVIEIGNYAFSYCSQLKTVLISEGVASIGYSTFEFCTSLTSISIPSSVSFVSDNAFAVCTNLLSINVEDANTNYSSENGILFNKEKTYLVCYPGGKQGEYVIPSTVTDIGNNAFSYCIGLSSVTISSSVNTIGGHVFENCTNLLSIEVDINNSNFSSQDGVLYNYDKTTLIYYPPGKQGGFIIPFSVTSVLGAFRGCTNLTSVVIPASVTNLGWKAFGDCVDLTSVTFETPSSLSSIEEQTFYNCTSLTSIKIPDNFTFIGNYAFENCTSLTSVEIPTSVTEIGTKAFYNCSKLNLTNLPASLTSISDYAFYGCESLSSVNISPLITSIGSYAFFSCENLTSVNFESPSSLTSIGSYAFGRCVNLSSLDTIPSSVNTIGEGVFSNCPSLESINVDASNFGYHSEDGILFNKNKNVIIQYPGGKVGNYSISSNVDTIAYNAFVHCPYLTSVTIPSTVTYFQNNFYDCSSLTSITVDADNSTYCSIGGVLFNKNKNVLIQCPGGYSGNYSVPASVDTILVYAFAYNEGLSSVNIPSSVTYIAPGAFFEGNNLTSISVDIDNTVYSSDNGVLFNKSKSKLITFPGGISGEYTIPQYVDTICNVAFAFCDKITSIVIPSTVTCIDSYAFPFCTNLSSIYINNSKPSNISISQWAFGYTEKTTCTFYVPKDTKETYESIVAFQDFIIEEMGKTGTTNIESNNVFVYASNGTLFFTGELEDETINVFNLQGYLLYKGKPNSSASDISLPQTGVYIVQVGNRTYKVLNK